MGIVCHCPNGHRIKVKDFLAGKIGICPSCSGRFRIPLGGASSARVPGRRVSSILRSRARPPVRPGPPAPSGPPARSSPPASASPPAASALPLAAVEPLDLGIAASSPAASVDSPLFEISLDDKPMIPAAISEAAAASWCIAVPGGQPSAAMTGEELLERLTSGRVTGGELVWRSDWSDWRPITDVFPHHVPPPFPPSRAAW